MPPESRQQLLDRLVKERIAKMTEEEKAAVLKKKKEKDAASATAASTKSAKLQPIATEFFKKYGAD